RARDRDTEQMKTGVTVRRARHLVSYWTDEGMVITNYATNSSVVGDALVAHILGHCAEWTSIPDLRARLTGIPQRSIDGLVAAMIKQRLLLRSDGRSAPRERALDTWSDWNPAAGFFHFSTKD